MKKRIGTLTILAVLFISTPSFCEEAGMTNRDLREELLRMKVADQKFRQPTSFDGAAVAKVDTENRHRLKEILEQYGWPTISMVGKDGAQAAWLLAQHADADPPFQARVLKLMEPLLERNEALPQNYAYLFDRLNKPQRFGTQGSCKSKGVWAPREIEDEADVDRRRAEVGMPPLRQYVETASKFLCVK